MLSRTWDARPKDHRQGQGFRSQRAKQTWKISVGSTVLYSYDIASDDKTAKQNDQLQSANMHSNEQLSTLYWPTTPLRGWSKIFGSN